MGYWQIKQDESWTRQSSTILNHLWQHMVPLDAPHRILPNVPPHAPVITVVVEMEGLLLIAHHAVTSATTSATVRAGVPISGMSSSDRDV